MRIVIERGITCFWLSLDKRLATLLITSLEKKRQNNSLLGLKNI